MSQRPFKMLVLKWLAQKKRCITLAICFALLGYLASKSLRQFLGCPTATSDSYAKATTAPFPVLTVCPTNGYKTDILQVPNSSTFWPNATTYHALINFRLMVYKIQRNTVSDILGRAKLILSSPLKRSLLLWRMFRMLLSMACK